MNTFRYSPEEARHQGYIQILPYIIVLAFAAIALLTGTYLFVPGIPLEDIFSTCLMTFGIFCVIGFIKYRSIATSIKSLQIIIESDRITKTQRESNSITISRSQVSRIVDIPDRGLRIESLLPGDLIFVPKDLVGFDKVKAILFQWHPPVIDTNRFPRILLLVLSTVILCGVLIIIKSTRIYGFALFFLCMIASFVASVVQSVRRFFIRRRLNKV